MVKEMSSYKFADVPKLNKKYVLDLARCQFIETKTNLVLTGPPGVGKSHFAIAFGREACRRGHKVKFFTASQLVNTYIEARQERMILKLEKNIQRCDLIIVDEFGYIPLDRIGAEHLFGFFSQCYEQTSLAVTTNLPFADWPQVFAEDERLAGALLDQRMGQAKLTKKYVHSALKDGKCSQCHETHSSENKFRLRAKTAGEMCAECHDVVEDATHVHGPTSVGECLLCHEAHESDYENRLTMGLDQLCVFCHVTTKEELEGIEFVHEPTRDNCVGCHDPHGADNWKMLKAEAPDLCFSCHEEIQTIAQASKHQHNAVLEPGGCLKCHTPHASSVRPLLAGVPTTLCLTCHAEPQGVTINEVLPAFIDQIKDKKYLHGPIKEGDCGGCHMTHGSDHFRILTAEYPVKFYTSFEETKYELCFSCHERTLVQMSTTDDLTDFRNGNQNLHFLHVNKEGHGRTCRACHQTHASNQLKHIRESVPYGGWKDLPINFGKTDTGGSCDPGCHLLKAYDRQTAVDYTVKPAKRKPRLNEAALSRFPSPGRAEMECENENDKSYHCGSGFYACIFDCDM